MDGHSHPLEPEPASDPRRGRVSGLLHRLPSPTYLWFLGLLSLPSILFDRLESLDGFALFFLFGLWPFVAGLASVVRPGGERAPVDATAWIDTGGGATAARASAGMLLTMFQPFVLGSGLLQFFGHVPIVARYRGSVPTPEEYERRVEYRLPFEGTWTVVNGSPDRRHSHSWSILTQRYAYDFVITDDEGRTCTGERSGPEAHYCFGEPILAPAAGTVVAAKTDHRDYHRTDGWLDPRQRDLRGNYVTIEHTGGEYSVLAHLQQGSVAVSEGDRLEQGDVIGRCGHSGNSTEPHLHFHVQDHPNFFLGMGLPVQFTDVVTLTPENGPPTDAEAVHHDRGYVHAGQLVAPAEGALEELEIGEGGRRLDRSRDHGDRDGR